MSGCEQKVQGSLSCLVHEVGVPAGLGRCWNSEDVGRNVCKTVGFLAVLRQDRQRTKPFFFPVLI